MQIQVDAKEGVLVELKVQRFVDRHTYGCIQGKGAALHYRRQNEIHNWDIRLTRPHLWHLWERHYRRVTDTLKPEGGVKCRTSICFKQNDQSHHTQNPCL